ncbi:MAG TPA: hypothetical protein VE710_20995 [Candidatus Bathyarchaeia archaeon]|nr:hypothetical protein [Candidatus Bathyarchaeia archaeon]
MRKSNLFAAILLILFIVPVPTYAIERNAFHISVTISPKAARVTTLKVANNPKFMKRILRAPAQKTMQTPEFPRATIQMGRRTFIYDSMDRLFEPAKKRQILLSAELRDGLDFYISQAEKQYYGQLLAWESVRKHFSRMAYGDVVDLETGERFRVQRRAGSRHADVQPLTRKDTEIMKRIYQGKWSWRRRAILVLVDDKAYAASMHGMPHGAGAIANNGFPGHFCIHFAGSTTHKRNEPDPSHSLMVMKASGKLPLLLMEAEPDQLVEWFLTAVREHDESVWRQTTTNRAPLPFSPDQLETLRMDRPDVQSGEISLQTALLPVKVRYYVKGEKEKAETWCFYLNRSSLVERWKIADIFITD